MRLPVTRHDRTRALALAWIVAGLAPAACGSPVSLDPPAPTTASSSGSTDASDSTTHAASSSGSLDSSPTDDDGPSRDVPEPLPPGACPQQCTLELDEVWSWSEEPPGPGSPLEVRIQAMIRASDGSLVLGEQRDDEVWLRRLSSNGVSLWTTLANLGCECEISGLAAPPGDSLLVAGHGPLSQGVPALMLGSYNLIDPGFHWRTWDNFSDSSNYRVGSVFSVDATQSRVLVIDREPSKNGVSEILKLYHYDGSFLYDRRNIDSQPPGQTDVLPVGWARGLDEIAVGFTDASGPQDDGYLLWLNSGHDPTALSPLVGPPETIAAGPDGEVALAGRYEGAPNEVSVHVSLGRPSLPVDWTFTTSIPAADSSAPAVTVHDDGAITLALRTTDDDGQSALTLWRLSPDGQLAWTLTEPIAPDPGPPPLYLEHDGDAVVIATILEGRSHVEVREPNCQCE